MAFLEQSFTLFIQVPMYFSVKDAYKRYKNVPSQQPEGTSPATRKKYRRITYLFSESVLFSLMDLCVPEEGLNN